MNRDDTRHNSACHGKCVSFDANPCRLFPFFAAKDIAGIFQHLFERTDVRRCFQKKTYRSSNAYRASSSVFPALMTSSGMAWAGNKVTV